MLRKKVKAVLRKSVKATLKLGKFSIKYQGYRFIKEKFRLYFACGHIDDFPAAKQWFVGIKHDHLYYSSCYTTLTAAMKAAEKKHGYVFRKSDVIFVIDPDYDF